METVFVTVRKAVEALHTSPDPAVQKEADKWLQEFRCSNEAWVVSVTLLEELKSHNGVCSKMFPTNNQPLPLQFYVSNTLQYKVRKQWDTLQDKGSLVSCLPPMLFSYANAHSSVRKQICLVCGATGKNHCFIAPTAKLCEHCQKVGPLSLILHWHLSEIHRRICGIF
jgi:hypothetical protein